MAYRRHDQSYDDWARPSYGSAEMAACTPRKWTSNMAAPSYNTYRYQTGDRVQDIKTPDVLQQYVGRKFVAWNGENVSEYVRATEVLRAAGEYESSPYAQIAHEYDISKTTRGAMFRIIMVRDGEILSKLSYEYRPAQYNIFLDAYTSIVVAISRG